MALAAAVLLACRAYGTWRVAGLAVLLAAGLAWKLSLALALAPAVGLLAGLQVERQKSYGQVVAAASLPGSLLGLFLLLVAHQDPGVQERLATQLLGQLETMGLALEGGGYSLRDLALLAVRLQPGIEFLTALLAAVVAYRLSQALAGRLGVELPPARPFRMWRPWDQLIWVLIAGLALGLVSQGLLADLAFNLVGVMVALNAVHGLALVRFFLWRLGISRWLELLLYAVMVFAAGLSILLLALLALMDTWFDWRRLEPEAHQVPSEEDSAS
jgi:hypothetical protein